MQLFGTQVTKWCLLLQQYSEVRCWLKKLFRLEQPIATRFWSYQKFVLLHFKYYCLKFFFRFTRRVCHNSSSMYVDRNHTITWLSCHALHIQTEKSLNETKIFEWNFWNWQNKTKLKENLNYRINRKYIIERICRYCINIQLLNMK